MIVEEDIEESAALQKRLSEITTSKFVQEDNIHVTNLIFCLAKSWYRIKHPDAEKPTSYMTDGILRHAQIEPIIVSEIESKSGTKPLTEQKHKWKGLTATIDIEAAIPYEVKTTESGKVRDFQIDQLRTYCLIKGVKEGKLIEWAVSRNPNMPKTFIKSFRVVFTEEELEIWEAEVLKRKRALSKALKEGKLDSLGDDSPRFDWECRFCAFNSRCPFARR